jgi:EAL domain-containing protein (putative c-di-GMP-specific phosphodiesterase class I)
MYSQTRPYRERLDELREILIKHGSLGLLLIDASQLAQVEHDYGSKAFENVLSILTELVVEMGGAEIRTSDLVTISDRGGNAFLVFLSPKRADRESRPRVADLEAAAQRVEEHLNAKLSRLKSPYLRGRHRITTGFSLVFLNPLVMPERLVARLVEEAWECVRIQKMQLEFQNRCRLQEILLQEQVTSRFQPVVDIQRGGILGYEALSRGPAGTAHHAPISMFEVAAQCDLVFELDRHCRRKALQSAREMPANTKLFINVLPSSLYDPDFQGQNLIGMLEDLGLHPERIVLEISERYAIENYALYLESIENLTSMGFSIAVDDVGAGYSGLERLTQIKPRYLKFDMQLVRGIDGSEVRREMARALKTFADKMGSTIIAEGIEREAELRTCIDLGLDYGQGYLLGRPSEGFIVPTLPELGTKLAQ